MTEEHIRNMKAKIPMGRLVQIDEVAELAPGSRARLAVSPPGFVFDITGDAATY